MSGVSWIKITTSMFEDEKIDFISALPEADTIIVIWLRLLTMAGRCNAGGYILLTENIPYTDEMLATRFRKPLNVVKLAIQTFHKLGMIEDTDNGLYIANWEKHQNIAGLEKIKEQTRARVAKHREVKQICNVTVTPDVTQCNAIELDIDKDSDKEKKERSKADAFDTTSPPYQLAQFLLERIRANKADFKEPNLQKWASDMDKLIRLDHRSIGDIKTVIAWAQRDSFWIPNILSPAKLRQKWDTLTLQMRPKTKQPTRRTNQSETAENLALYDDPELILRRMREAASGK